VSVKLMEQAQFAVTQVKLDRAKNYAENLFAYSNKYGVLLVAKGNKLIASSISEFEKDFQGGDEQEIDTSMVISTKVFQSSITFVALAASSDYVAVNSEGKVHVYHMSMFLDKVRNALLYLHLSSLTSTTIAFLVTNQASQPAEAMQSVEADFGASNFSCSWNAADSNADIQLLVLADKTLTVVSPINGVVATYAIEGQMVGAAAWVRDLKSMHHALVALSAQNAITIRDSITWAVVAKVEGLIEAGEKIGKLPLPSPSCAHLLSISPLSLRTHCPLQRSTTSTAWSLACCWSDT